MRVGGIFLAGWVAVVAGGCGLGLGGLEDTPGTDAGDAPDALVTGDGTVPDDGGAPPEAAVADTTDKESAADAPEETEAMDSPAPPPAEDAGCQGVNLLCPGTNICATDCTACPGSPIQCFACNASRMDPIGTCQPQNTNQYCLDENYAGNYEGGQGYHCTCVTAADCPGDTQVCIAIGGMTPLTFGCFTCGEAFTDKASCKAGQGKATCNVSTASCK